MRARLIIVSLLAVSLFVFSCAPGQRGMIVRTNRMNLLKLSVGMTKQEVLDIMGTKAVRGINNPYRIEAMMDKNGHVHEFLFYYTDDTVPGRIADSEMTPLVIIDGKLVGWGRGFFTEHVDKLEVRVR